MTEKGGAPLFGVSQSPHGVHAPRGTPEDERSCPGSRLVVVEPDIHPLQAGPTPVGSRHPSVIVFVGNGVGQATPAA